MEIIFVFGIMILISVCIVVGNFGSKRNIGFTLAFLSSLFLSPILGMMFVLASDKKKKPTKKVQEINKKFKDDSIVPIIMVIVSIFLMVGIIING